VILDHTQLKEATVDNSELLTAAELALKLKVTLAAIRAWQRAGIPYVPAGRLPRYQLAAVQAWLQDRAERQRQEREARRQQKAAEEQQLPEAA